jgi:hemerythrin-like domain-containing protein
MKKAIAKDIREQVLGQHARLRDALGSLHRLARSDDVADCERLREEAVLFLSALSMHLDFEERALLPVLENIDAWGKERVNRMREEHKEQRAVIADLEKIVANSLESREHVITAIEAFRTRLLADMALEEKEELSGRLFSDDVVQTDMFDG